MSTPIACFPFLAYVSSPPPCSGGIRRRHYASEIYLTGSNEFLEISLFPHRLWFRAKSPLRMPKSSNAPFQHPLVGRSGMMACMYSSKGDRPLS